MRTASVQEMSSHFKTYLKDSVKGPVLVTRQGKPVAMLLAVDDEEELERYRLANSPRLLEILEAAEKRFREGKGIPAEEFWANYKKKKAGPTNGRKKTKKKSKDAAKVVR